MKGTELRYRGSEPELCVPEDPCRLIKSCGKGVNNEFVHLEGERQSISSDGVTSILKTAGACASPLQI